MAISDELRAQILRYHFVEHWRVGTIASQLRVHHYTVERVLGEASVERERQRRRRASKLDPYRAFIADCRREHLDRLSHRLVSENQVIAIEDLNAEGMGRSARAERACEGGAQPGGARCRLGVDVPMTPCSRTVTAVANRAQWAYISGRWESDSSSMVALRFSCAYILIRRKRLL